MDLQIGDKDSYLINNILEVENIRGRMVISIFLLLLYNALFLYSVFTFNLLTITFLLILILLSSFYFPVDVSQLLYQILEFYDKKMDNLEKKFNSIRKHSLSKESDLYYQVFVYYNKSVIIDLIVLVLIWSKTLDFLINIYLGGSILNFWFYLKSIISIPILAHLIYNLTMPKFEGINSLKYYGYFDRIEKMKKTVAFTSFSISSLLVLIMGYLEVNWFSASLSDILYGNIFSIITILPILLFFAFFTIFRGISLSISVSKKPLFLFTTLAISLSILSIFSITTSSYLFGIFNNGLLIASIVSIFITILLLAMILLRRIIGALGLFVASPTSDRLNRLIGNRYKFIVEMHLSLKIGVVVALISIMILYILSFELLELNSFASLLVSYLFGHSTFLGMTSAYAGLSYTISNLQEDLANEERKIKDAIRAIKRQKRRAKKVVKKIKSKEEKEMNIREYTKILEEFESIFAESESNEL